MKLFSILVAVILLAAGSAQAGDEPLIAIHYDKNGKVISRIVVFASSDCPTTSTQVVCKKQAASQQSTNTTSTTNTWKLSAQPNITSTWQGSSPVVQPVIIEQPVIVQEATPVIRSSSPTAFWGTSYGFASASIGINTYGGYYPAYWQENNRCNELANYRYAQRAYGVGVSRGGYGSYGYSRYTGENRNSGVRPMPPLGPRMYYHH